MKYYYKYLKYKNKYCNLKKQIGGEITDEGRLVNLEYIEENKYLVNHALQIFNVDNVADIIKEFNDRYVISGPIISIGSGQGLLEAYTHNKHGIDFFAVEPESDPSRNAFMRLHHFLWRPESNITNDRDLFETMEDKKLNRSLLLNWCYPGDEYGNYDYNYIARFLPHSILSISNGIESQEIKQKRKLFFNIIQYLFQKNIKYDKLKEFSKSWFTLPKMTQKQIEKNIESYLENPENVDNIKSNPSALLNEILKRYNEMNAKEELDGYTIKLGISYDILFYLNKLLLHYINKYNTLFTKLTKIDLNVDSNNINLLTIPSLPSIDYKSFAGGNSFNKFLDDVNKRKKRTLGGENYKNIKSIKKKINFNIDGIKADIADISFDINFIIKNDIESVEPILLVEPIDTHITIEYVLYHFLIKINNILLEKINNILIIIQTNDTQLVKFRDHFSEYRKLLSIFYKDTERDGKQIHVRKEDNPDVTFIFNRHEDNYVSVLGLE